MQRWTVHAKSKPGLRFWTRLDCFQSQHYQKFDVGHISSPFISVPGELRRESNYYTKPRLMFRRHSKEKNMIWPLPTDQTDPNVATKQTTPFMSQYVHFVACGSNLNSCLIQFCHNSLENKPASFYHLGGPLRHTSDVSHNALRKHKH